MKTLGSLLCSIFKTLGIEDKIKLSAMQEEWHNLFNEPLSLHTYPVEIKDGELLINVDSPAWLGQLKFFTQDIIKKLNAYNVDSVRFKHGRVYHKKRQLLKGNWHGDSNQYAKHISDSDMEWINEIVATVSDSELKENIEKVIKESLKKRAMR